ncbi:MAG TPA: 4-hydroxythreonine-4-phosphate dehydrogenase PdxA [Planctomycetaceae bacterium]|nr:4-hydroxythreonine-4-phosphate dehydrogenase PdxA [Planctomycetaceae bacterium]
MPESLESQSPRLALLMGDVAGVGPEVVARTLAAFPDNSRPLVVGHPDVLVRALELVGLNQVVQPVDSPHRASGDDDQPGIDCWNPSTADVSDIPAGLVDARCGRAAADWLLETANAALDGHVDALVTAPLNKAALAAAGIDVPGHTELLARACGQDSVGMMLYLPPTATSGSNSHGLGVTHVTLHTSIASVPGLLSTSRISDHIRLIDGFLRRIGCTSPRVGVCALNPHAGEDGLFGNEEQTTIAPAVADAIDKGLDARGPFPADTLLHRAASGEFDGVVAMYHDQGHIALKLIGFQAAVNVTLGLPIVRTSPSHGTAFDIAWQGVANPAGMLAAVDSAIRLCQHPPNAQHTHRQLQEQQD